MVKINGQKLRISITQNPLPDSDQPSTSTYFALNSCGYMTIVYHLVCFEHAYFSILQIHLWFSLSLLLVVIQLRCEDSTAGYLVLGYLSDT